MSATHLDGGCEVTRRWFAELYGDAGDGWLTLFTLHADTAEQQVVWRRHDQLDALTNDTARCHDRNVWFGVATRKQRTRGRGGAADCAAIPGLWVDIDIAGPNHKGGQPLPTTLDEAYELLRAYPLPPTVIVNSGGGLQGWWLFRELLGADDAAPLLVRWGHTWAEYGRTRGWHVDNVFDLARIMRVPGSTNHKHTPTPVEILEADYTRRYNPDDLDQYTTDPPPPPDPQPAGRIPYIGPQRPGDAFNATRNGAEVLAMAGGFTFVRRDASGDHYHYATSSNPTAATVYTDGHTTIWSETAVAKWPRLELRRPYDPFGLYATMFHDGDWRTATKALADLGYGERNMAHDDFSWVALGDDSEEWAPPVDASAPLPQEYPIDVLPAWMSDYCVALADEMQVPVDLCAQVALGAWSAICSGRAKIRIAGRWTEHLNLFLAAVMPSGGGKSPVSKRLTGPLRTLEVELAEQYRKVIAEAKAERKVLERQLSAAEREGDRERIAYLNMELDTLVVPSPPRLVVDDVTQEMLAVLLHRHGGRMALISTEATMFDMACGLYSGASKRTNNNVYLQGWSADTLTIDRKGSSTGEGTEIRIPEPVLTVAITVQPQTIAELAKHPELAGRGFTARFMYAAPSSKLGYRDRWKILQIDNAQAADTYERTFLAFARRFVAWEHPALLVADDAAARRFVGWLADMEPLIGDGADLEAVSEWTAKLHASVARVAGLLHLADGRTHDDPVGVDVVERAIRLGEYWISHAVRIAELWEGDPIAELAKATVQRHFIEGGVTEFDSGDVHQNWHRRRVERIAKDRGDDGVRSVVYDVLVHLADRNCIRPASGGSVERLIQGKPRQRFVVNPLLTVDNANNANNAREVENENRGRDNAHNARVSLERDATNTLSLPLSLSASSDIGIIGTFSEPTGSLPPSLSTSSDIGIIGIFSEPTGYLFADPDGHDGGDAA